MTRSASEDLCSSLLRLQDFHVLSPTPLPYSNFTNLPSLPPDVAAAINPALQSPLIGWDMATLVANRELYHKQDPRVSCSSGSMLIWARLPSHLHACRVMSWVQS